MERLEVRCGDALGVLRELPEGSVQCCVTSPPYWGLRDYGTAKWEGGDSECDHKAGVMHSTNGSTLRLTTNKLAGLQDSDKTANQRYNYRELCGKCGARRIDSQLGLEKTPEEYVAKMVAVFREVRRVLKDDGTLWLNLGDSYSSGGRGSYDNALVSRTSGVQNNSAGNARNTPAWAKPKDLIGIPWMVAFALRADGWYLRSDIIWAKPNPMPESVRDRPTKAHEYMFLMTKSQRYYYDGEAIAEPSSYCGEERKWPAGWAKDGEPHDALGFNREVGRAPRLPDYFKGSLPGRNGGPGQDRRSQNDRIAKRYFQGEEPAARNKRSVWTVATAPYPEAHFATFPPDLIKPCILAGSKAGDTILDPFAGSGTTGQVALELGRKAILIELNPKYVELIRARCNVTPGLAF